MTARQFTFPFGIIVRLQGNSLDGIEFQYSVDSGKTFSEWLPYYGQYKQLKRVADDIHRSGFGG